MLLRSARLAFHGTALLLVAIFTLGLLIAANARLLGIPLAAVLVPLFFKYCFVVLDAAIAGHDEPPVMSVELANPVNEPRPISQALLIVAGVLVVKAVYAYVGHAAGVLVGALLIFIFPATIASLGLNSNPFIAAWPPRWIEIIRGLKGDYLVLNMLVLAAAAIVYTLVKFDAPGWIDVAAQQLLLLFVFAAVGRALFEHRIDFGLLSRSPEEHLEEREHREHRQTRQRMIDDAYVQFRHNKPQEGWTEIEAWLAEHAQGVNRLSEYYAVLDAASQWDDVRPADRLANDLIALLLTNRETGVALEVVERRIATNPLFRPAQAVRLAELAGLAGKRALRRQLGPAK